MFTRPYIGDDEGRQIDKSLYSNSDTDKIQTIQQLNSTLIH